jgi:hypothetical protein
VLQEGVVQMKHLLNLGNVALIELIKLLQALDVVELLALPVSGGLGDAEEGGDELVEDDCVLVEDVAVVAGLGVNIALHFLGSHVLEPIFFVEVLLVKSKQLFIAFKVLVQIGGDLHDGLLCRPAQL